jgi:hypothetical protein
VLFDRQVIPGKHFERRERTVRHLDLHVHTARAHKRGVEFLHVVRRENENALVAATRPQAVNEVQQP